MSVLRLHQEPTARVRGVLIACDRRTGAVTRRVVTCVVPANLFAKSGIGFGQTTAQGERWITIHPHGDDQPGQPVKIRESKTERGVWHVIGGAGGKLNYLKLTGVKTPEEYRTRATAKKEARRAHADKQLELDKARKSAMTDDERKVEAERARTTREAHARAVTELHTRQQEFIAHVAARHGWQPDEWQFDATRARLAEAGATKERIGKLEDAHHARVYQKARDAVAKAKRQVLADRDRAAALLGEAPLVSDDPDTVAVSDLLPGPATPRGKGFQAITRSSSDTEIRAALAAEDQTRLRADLEEARAALAAHTQGMDEHQATAAATTPELAARVQDLAAQLHTAELVEAAARTTPVELAARRAEVRDATATTVQAQGTYAPDLGTLRNRSRGDGAPLMAEERDRLDAFELQAANDARRLETLRAQAIDLAVIAGETMQPAIAGEGKTVSAHRQATREAEIRAEHGEPGVQGYRAMLAKLRSGSEKYRAEMRRYKDTGALRPSALTPAPVDPEHALDLIAREKALRKMERELAQAEEKGEDLDAKMFGKGYFTATGAPTPAAIAAAEKSLTAQILEQKTRAFLEQAESPELLLGRGGVFREDYDQRDLGRALERHLSAGAYHALNNAGLAALQTPVLSREVVDTLGAAGAAQLLGHVMAAHETAATRREMAASLGAYHVRANVAEAGERLREVEAALDRADEAMAHVTNPAEVAVALAANERRQAALEEARQTIGQALGEYEATAALAQALGEGTRKDIHVNLGPIGTETAIRQLRALGLDRKDYAITSDGTNYFATIQASGFPTLAAPVDRAHQALVDDVLAIKQGERDDPHWKPAGTIARPASSLTADGLEPPSLTATLKPLGNVGDGGDPATDIREHIALRAANGEHPNDILADLHAHILDIPAAHRGAAEAEVHQVFPLMQPVVEHGTPIYQHHPTEQPTRDRAGTIVRDATGAPVMAPHPHAGNVVLRDDGTPQPLLAPTTAAQHQATVDGLVTDHFRTHGLPRTAALNGQSIAVTDDPRTREAFTRALARDPRAMVAFTPPSDLTDEHQHVLRHFFASDIAPADAATGYDAAAVDARVAALGPAPTQTSPGLFGGEETTPEWREWKRQRDAIVAAAHGDPAAPKTTSWAEYVAAMGGTGKAYEALQDRLKSGFAHEFHRAYTTLHQAPLRIGVRPIAHAELHQSYLDPTKRAALLGERRRLLDDARTRAAGKYAAGSALEKMERIAQDEEIQRQNQMGLLGASPEATSRVRREPAAHERYTLGTHLEGQIGALMPAMARNFRPGEPVKLLADKHWADPPGTPARFIHQQRTIKQFERSKRLAAALGTGSGKTSIGIASLTDLRAQPASGVQRGLFVVPSSVQGQFGAEFTRFVAPGTLNWAANPGGDRAQRLAEHANPDVHAVVHTHQAFRDDMLHMLATHWGSTPEEAKTRFMGLPRHEAASAMREAWRRHGVDYQMLMVDEGHGLLDRSGKPDSLLSRIAQAASDTTPYYMSASADPVKNDVTELRSLLDKLEPNGRFSDAGDWKRRYGVNTIAAAEALKREVAPYVYAAAIPSGTTVRRRRETVALHPEQERAYAEALHAFERLQAARENGTVDVDAAKTLAPARFAGRPDTEHAALAREVQRNPGTLKEQALGRVVDLAPRETNAKIQHLVRLLKDHPVKTKPVVVFAHNLKAVHEITEALAEAGHRVQSLTGGDSTAERDRKRLRFQPETGTPEADVFVLSDAGQAGLNLQRGQTLVQYDRPLTAMGHAQRNGRIDRLGQQQAVDLIDLTTDTPYEARAHQRIERKYALRNVLTDPAAALDDTGVASAFREARARAATPDRKVA